MYMYIYIWISTYKYRINTVYRVRARLLTYMYIPSGNLR